MIELLEHNVETYQNLCKEMEKHNKVALIQATGTGKSYIISKYIEEHCHNALILVPANAIGDQWQKLLPDTEVKTYQAMANGIDGEYDLIVADEMHHLGSNVWGQKFIEYFMQNPEQKVIGATATEIRWLDNARDMAEEIFNGIAVRGVDIATAIDKGILSTFKYVIAYYGSEEDFDEYREKIDSIKDIEQRNDISKRLEMCLQNRISIKTAMYENLSMANHNIIVFLNGLCEIDEAVGMFTDMFPDCECNYVSSQRSNGENEASISRFQQSTKQISILLAVDMLNEGVHIEGVDVCVMFRNTESPQVYFQQMGRVLDTNGGSDRVIFDFACNAKSIKANISDNEETNTILSINAKIRDKKKKIILRSYTEEIENVLQQVRAFTAPQYLTEEQRKFIEENSDKYTCTELSRLLQVNRSTIRTYCKNNGISLKKGRHYLTEEQKKIIAENAEKYSCSEMSEIIGASNATIWHYCKQNGISLKNVGNIPLTVREKEWLLENKEKAYTELAAIIGRSPSGVKQFLTQCGNGRRSAARWSKEEDEILRQNREMTVRELKKLLPCRNTQSIQSRRNKLGLGIEKKTKTDSIIELYKRGEDIENIADAVQTNRRYVIEILTSQGLKKKTDRRRLVAKINPTTGETVTIYKSIAEAARECGKSCSSINLALREESKIVYGFKRQYID